ncbi:Clavaminate synthase-like protein [Parathielavia appendiculata]|uniref:Clavaminate synthase-like protein n=1 Tax=Parathielavia appendiculata TaxID=2587402 RepID=A0AAN6Z6Z0_9PEZI|nr:Clavaminate synthase-like protein [Parathielavia appendiculata]
MRHGIHTTTGLAWHCDMGIDPLALHVRSLAATGGSIFVASSWTIYKELVAVYAEVLNALRVPSWPIQMSGDPPRYIVAPLLHISRDKIIISVDPERLGLHPATAKTGLRGPRTSLELGVQYRHRLDTREGDMVFINNFALLHDRDSYVDLKYGRHFVRLWHRNPELAWYLPRIRGAREVVPRRATFEYKPPKYTAGSAAFILEDSEDVNGKGLI